MGVLWYSDTLKNVVVLKLHHGYVCFFVHFLNYFICGTDAKVQTFLPPGSRVILLMFLDNVASMFVSFWHEKH